MGPIQILKQAIQAVPATKYALGVAGVAAAVAIVAGIIKDPRIAIFGTILLFGMMFILVIFSSIAGVATATIKVLAHTLGAFFVILIMATSLFIFTSFFFDWPKPLETYLPEKNAVGPEVAHAESAPPPLPDVEPALRDKIGKWVDRIFSLQDTNGGIKVLQHDPSSKPQVWSTAQCLKAVLSAQVNIDKYVAKIRAGLDYIEAARRTEPQAGWGLFEEREYTQTEIAAWVALARIESMESKVKIWQASELSRIVDLVESDLDLISERQEADGGWRPFELSAAGFTRTYSTVMAVWALVEARRSSWMYQRIGARYDDRIQNGVHWLLQHYDKQIGWVPNPNRRPQYEPFEGLTAQTLFVLSRAEGNFPFIENDSVYVNAEKSFAKKQEFAMRALWNNNRIHDGDITFRPSIYQLEPSTFLWFPWTVLELTHLSNDTSLSPDEREQATKLRRELLTSNADKLIDFTEGEFIYVLAETLFCLSRSLGFAGSADWQKG